MKEVMISVVIPTHNRPDFLERAVASIQEQKFKDWELIVVDDGSIPKVKQRNYSLIAALSDDRIKYRYQESAGPGAARKRGLEEATGRYFVLLDDDDYLLPDHLKSVADWLVSHELPESVINTGLINEYPGGKQEHHAAIGDQINGDQLLQFWQSPRNLTAFVFPRMVTDLVPIDPTERVIEDFAWLSRILVHFHLQRLPAFTAVYVHHGQNRNNTLIDPAWLSGRIRVVRSSYDYENTSVRVPKAVKNKLLCHECWHYARQCWSVDEWRKGMHGFMKGFQFVGWGNMRELGYTLFFCLRSLFASLRPR